MCNNCTHAPVCGKCKATGGHVGKCEYFAEERHGWWEPDGSALFAADANPKKSRIATVGPEWTPDVSSKRKTARRAGDTIGGAGMKAKLLYYL